MGNNRTESQTLRRPKYDRMECGICGLDMNTEYWIFWAPTMTTPVFHCLTSSSSSPSRPMTSVDAAFHESEIGSPKRGLVAALPCLNCALSDWKLSQLFCVKIRVWPLVPRRGNLNLTPLQIMLQYLFSKAIFGFTQYNACTERPLSTPRLWNRFILRFSTVLARLCSQQKEKGGGFLCPKILFLYPLHFSLHIE